MRFIDGIVAGLVLGLTAPLAGPETVGADEHPVEAHLVADVAAISPGAAFGLGVLLEMEEDWHVYWRNSGDSGGPTRVEWILPAGSESTDLQWPAPHKYTDYIGQDEFVTYGYEQATMLMAEIRAPQHLPPGSEIELKAAVSWFVCSDLCIPGDTTLTLSLPIQQAGREAGHRQLFEDYRAQLPVAYSAADPLSVTAHAGPTTSGLIVQVQLSVRDGGRTIAELEPDFFPFRILDGPEFDLFSAHMMSPPSADGVGLTMEVQPYDEVPSRLGGVLSYLDEDGKRAYRSLELDLEDAGSASALPMSVLAGADFTRPESQSLLLYILFAALGGLILNVMPCVLPVISLKVLGFVSHAQQERRRVRQLGAAFAAGIVASFAVLAGVVIAIKAGGEQIGWGFQFQSPVFVLALTGLIFVLALSLFGLLTITLPGTRTNLGGLADSHGLTGSFFNGVLATILATPCTAPFLGSSLGFAFTQPGGVILAIFVATGMGMALPYLVLAAEPGWMRSIPKPGPWMEHFKQGMGFLLMATVLWLLWVLGKQLGVEAVIWTAAFLLCLALALWIPGKWTDLRSSSRQRTGAWSAALVVIAGGYLLFLHPFLQQERQLNSGLPTQVDSWQSFSIERVEELVSGGNHVFIDFTAEWCWTCKVNKRTVLDGEAVQDRFDELGVQRVRADWTNRNPEITAFLRSFGRSGVPFYVIFPAGRVDHPLVLPELITTSIVLQQLDEAARLSLPNLAAGDPSS